MLQVLGLCCHTPNNFLDTFLFSIQNTFHFFCQNVESYVSVYNYDYEKWNLCLLTEFFCLSCSFSTNGLPIHSDLCAKSTCQIRSSYQEADTGQLYCGLCPNQEADGRIPSSGQRDEGSSLACLRRFCRTRIGSSQIIIIIIFFQQSR
jgi:hypothetical protein